MAEVQAAPIPFVNDQKSGNEPLGGASPNAMNILVAGTAVRRRPGLKASGVAPAVTINGDGVSLLHRVANGSLFAVAGVSPNRNLYKVTSGGSVNLSMVSEGDLRGTARPVAAETQSILAIAGGNRMQKVELLTNASSPVANAPASTRVIANARRLLALDPDTDGMIRFSQTASGSSFAGFEDWEGVDDLNFFTADARPDELVALAENTNEIFSFGSESLQVFGTDELRTYAPVVTRELGCSAPYSVIKADQQFAWLDHLRRFVISDGRQARVLSEGMEQTLTDMETVGDCFGFRFLQGPVDAFVWKFPSDGRALVYQQGAGWAQWQGMDLGAWDPIPVNCHHYLQGDAVNLVGLTDGRIAELDLNTATDFGEPINASVTTGYQNRGTDLLKQCRAIRIALRRGEPGSADEPVGKIWWRDDTGEWEPPLEVAFGESGEREIVVTFRGLGIYRRRQWRFEFLGEQVFSLVGATEEFQVLGA